MAAVDVADDMSKLSLINEDGPEEIRIFVGNLSPSTTEQTFREYWEALCPCDHAVVKHPTENAPQRTRSYGFFTTYGEENAAAILAQTHISELAHRSCYSCRASPVAFVYLSLPLTRCVCTFR